MAVQTVLGHIGMFGEKGAPFFRMALDTGLLDVIFLQVRPGKTAVGIMAVYTKNPALPQRVMARHGEFNPGGFMAGETELAGRQWSDLQVRTGMDIVTVETGNLVQ